MGSICDNCTCGKAEGCAPAAPDRGVRPGFRKELETLINCHNKEAGSNTPDFILAEFLISCLEAYDRAVSDRDMWTLPQPEPVDPPQGPQSGT